MNLLLIGPRASGKTTIGRLVAERLGRPLVDLDDVALARFDEAGVADVWRVHGEAAWRAAECAALNQVLDDDGQVVALGGGTPMIPGARQRIDHERGTGRARIVYLRTDVGTLAERLEAGPGDRPSLTGAGIADEIETILARRAETYEALADLVVDAGGDPEAVAEAVAAAASSR